MGLPCRKFVIARFGCEGYETHCIIIVRYVECLPSRCDQRWHGIPGEVRGCHIQQAEPHTQSEWVQTWLVCPQEQALWCHSTNIRGTCSTCEESSIHRWMGLATGNCRQSCLPKSRWLGMGAQRWCVGNTLDHSPISYSGMPWTGKVWLPPGKLRQWKVQLLEERISMYWTVHLQVSSLARLNPYSIKVN